METLKPLNAGRRKTPDNLGRNYSLTPFKKRVNRSQGCSPLFHAHFAHMCAMAN